MPLLILFFHLNVLSSLSFSNPELNMEASRKVGLEGLLGTLYHGSSSHSGIVLCIHSFILFHNSLLGTGDAKTNQVLDIELTISISSSNPDYPILPINKVICPPPLTSALTIPHCLASFFLPPATLSSTPDLQQKNTHLCLPHLEYGQI